MLKVLLIYVGMLFLTSFRYKKSEQFKYEIFETLTTQISYQMKKLNQTARELEFAIIHNDDINTLNSNFSLNDEEETIQKFLNAEWTRKNHEILKILKHMQIIRLRHTNFVMGQFLKTMDEFILKEIAQVTNKWSYYLFLEVLETSVLFISLLSFFIGNYH